MNKKSIIYKEKAETLNELFGLINKKFTHFTSNIFRGHSSSNWKLESTLTRSMRRLDEEYKMHNNIRELHLERFKKNIRGKTKHDLKNYDENEIWALGQHFGLFSPLLDWTDSPYVALYFSLLDESSNSERCIWAFQEDEVERINKQKLTKDSIDIVRSLTNENQRLLSQQGLFLKIPDLVDLVSWVEESDADSYEHISLFKITFPDSLRKECISVLNTMNINHLTLFPDLSGSSLHTNFLLEIDPYLRNERKKIWQATGFWNQYKSD